MFALALLLSYVAPAALQARPAAEPQQPELGARVVTLLRVDGALFKDLDKNGALDAYEDWRRPVAERARGPRLAHDSRGEGRADGRPVPTDGPGRHAERAAGLRRQSLQRRTRGARLAGHDRRPPQAPHRPVHQPREPGAADDGEVVERRAGAGGGTTAGHAGAVRDQPAQPLRRAGQLRDRRGLGQLLAVARHAGPGRHSRRRAGGGVRPDRRPGVRVRGDPRRLPPDRGRGDRAALGALPRDLRRGRDAHRRADRRRDPRIPGARARPEERRAHDEALPRRGAGERRAGRALPVGQEPGLPGRKARLPPACRGRRRSRPARR